METLFNVPVISGANQFVPANEMNDNYPTYTTVAAQRTYFNKTPILIINYLNYIRHDVNQGKGAAIQAGIAQATGECLLVWNAVLKYDPGP